MVHFAYSAKKLRNNIIISYKKRHLAEVAFYGKCI